MNANEQAIRSANFSVDVDDASRGYWLNAEELVHILGLPEHLSEVLRSLKKTQSERVGLVYSSVQVDYGGKSTKFFFLSSMVSHLSTLCGAKRRGARTALSAVSVARTTLSLSCELLIFTHVPLLGMLAAL